MKFRLAVDDRVVEVEADERSVRVDGRSARATVRKGPRGYAVTIGRKRFVVRPGLGGAFVNGVWRRIATSDIRDEVGSVSGRSEARMLLEVRPPMSGHVVGLLVAPGDAVRRGQPLLVLEAMKMQNEVPAPIAGVVESLRVREGDSVTAHDVLAVIRGS